MKQLLLAILVVFTAYSSFKRADAVQSIDFRGENYALSDHYKRSGSDVYMYSPGGENVLRAGKYIQVAHLPQVEIPAEEFRRQYEEAFKKADGYKKLTENSFFYIEAKSFVHSALIQEGDKFKLYAFAEIPSEEELRNSNGQQAKRSIARELEETITKLPEPPRTFSTWF